jgi:ribose 5-phosphate isomerase B
MIYIGADHRGFKLKEDVKNWLDEWGAEYQDLGNHKYEIDDDYPDVAFKVAQEVIQNKGKGILICGSGVGACVAVNKVKGIRAGLCSLPSQVKQAREDDDINVICLAGEMVESETNKEIIKLFLETRFSSEERHIRRINKIKAYESTISG